MENHFYFVVFQPCKPLKNSLFLFAINLSTKCYADERDSNEIGGDKKSKLSVESGGGGDGLEGNKSSDAELMENVVFVV